MWPNVVMCFIVPLPNWMHRVNIVLKRLARSAEASNIIFAEHLSFVQLWSTFHHRIEASKSNCIQKALIDRRNNYCDFQCSCKHARTFLKMWTCSLMLKKPISSFCPIRQENTSCMFSDMIVFPVLSVTLPPLVIQWFISLVLCMATLFQEC